MRTSGITNDGDALKPRKKISRRLVLGMALGAALVGVGSGVAWAFTIDTITPTSNYGFACAQGTGPNTGSVCQTDNGSVSVWFEASISGSVNEVANIKDSLNGSYDPISNLSISYPSTKVTTGPGETDIIYQKGSMPAGSGLSGYTWCDDPVDGATYSCDQQYVRFLQGYYVYRSLACHETGHGIGLLHGPSVYPERPNDSTDLGCMRRPDTATNSGGTAGLGTYNVDSIHDTY